MEWDSGVNCHLRGSTSSRKWGRGHGGGTAELRNLGCSLQNERQRKHFDLDRDLLATGNYNVVMLRFDI